MIWCQWAGTCKKIIILVAKLSYGPLIVSFHFPMTEWVFSSLVTWQELTCFGEGGGGSHYYNTNKCQNGERDQYAGINLSRRYAMYQTWQTLCVSIHTYALFKKNRAAAINAFLFVLSLVLSLIALPQAQRASLTVKILPSDQVHIIVPDEQPDKTDISLLPAPVSLRKSVIRRHGTVPAQLDWVPHNPKDRRFT